MRILTGVILFLTLSAGCQGADETVPADDAAADEAPPAEPETPSEPSDGEDKATGLIVKTDDPGALYYSPPTDLLMALPESYDSRTAGFVTPTKNQGNCGSCWSFARVKAHEAQAIAAGKFPQSLDLSEQDLLSNSKTDHGCAGGYLGGEYEFKTGVTTEAECPYTGNDRTACNGAKVSKISKWAYIGSPGKAPTADELKSAILQYKVITVAVAADSAFQRVRGDRVTSCSGKNLNHAINLVGWSGDEFIIANSWGEGWGKGGFALSRQGCNGMAASANTAVFYYVEGQAPAPTPDPGPSPTPTPTPTPDPGKPAKLELPIEIVIRKGDAAALHVRGPEGMQYVWSNGAKGDMTWVTPARTTTYFVGGIDPSGAKTHKNVKVTVR